MAQVSVENAVRQRFLTYALDSKPSRNGSVLLHLFGLLAHISRWLHALATLLRLSKTDKRLLRAEACSKSGSVWLCETTTVNGLFWDGMMGKVDVAAC